jgi:hypothetical protein
MTRPDRLPVGCNPLNITALPAPAEWLKCGPPSKKFCQSVSRRRSATETALGALTVRLAAALAEQIVRAAASLMPSGVSRPRRIQ